MVLLVQFAQSLLVKIDPDDVFPTITQVVSFLHMPWSVPTFAGVGVIRSQVRIRGDAGFASEGSNLDVSIVLDIICSVEDTA